MKKQYYDLFLDMDEVIYDLTDVVRKHVNHDYHKNYPYGFNQSYFWSDYVEIPHEYFEQLLQQKGIFFEGNPVAKSIETINKLHEEGFNIHILTLPQHSQYCYFEKVQWVKKYLPFIDLNTNFHTTGNKELLAYCDRILIDDNIKHLENWCNYGGVSICLEYGWNKKWNGIRTKNWDEIYLKIHEGNDYITKIKDEFEDYTRQIIERRGLALG